MPLVQHLYAPSTLAALLFSVALVSLIIAAGLDLSTSRSATRSFLRTTSDWPVVFITSLAIALKSTLSTNLTGSSRRPKYTPSTVKVLPQF